MIPLLFAAYGAFVTVCIIAIIVFIIRRQKTKKEETFEKRDNWGYFEAWS